MNMKERVVRLMEKKLIFSYHAIERMLHPSRSLTKEEVKEPIRKGDVIEQQRPAVLLLQSRSPTICVVVGLCNDYLVVITAWRGTK